VVEELKSGAWTQSLLGAARTLGHKRRLFVDIAWIGTTLRLEARGRRLELRPTAGGIVAVRVEGQEDGSICAVDTKAGPEAVLEPWFDEILS